MPIKQITTEPELVLEHNGIKVYRTYMENDEELPEQFIFTTRKSDTDSTSPSAFDLRDFNHLPSIQALVSQRPELVDSTYARKRGLDLATYTLTPEYLALRVSWDEWWDTTMPALIRQAIIEAIDGGNIN